MSPGQSGAPGYSTFPVLQTAGSISVYASNGFGSGGSLSSTAAVNLNSSSTGTPYIGFDQFTVNGASLGLDPNDSGKFKLFVGSGNGAFTGSARLTVTSGGLIGINTTSPSYQLDVAGNVRVTGTITAPSPTWIFPSVASAFTQYGGEWASVSYSKDGFAKVYLRGFLTYNGTANTTTVIFTLPSGMYPPYNSQFSVTSLSTTATGCVLVCGANAASSASRYPGQVTYNGFSGNYFRWIRYPSF